MKQEIPQWLAITVMLIVAIVSRVLYDLKSATKKTWLGVFTSFFVSLLGGLVAGSLSRVVFELPEYQWVAVAVGAWTGQKIVETIAEAYTKKFNININKDGE